MTIREDALAALEAERAERAEQTRERLLDEANRRLADFGVQDKAGVIEVDVARHLVVVGDDTVALALVDGRASVVERVDGRWTYVAAVESLADIGRAL